jgi:transcriptional regulator with XRE-family HTH domain
MTSDRLSLGEYIRRLRKQAKRSLYSLAEETRISYSHLSRIENSSTVPNADTVTRIAEALDGDLKLMLEMADCLPRAILDRIAAREELSSPTPLRRALEGESKRPGPPSGSSGDVDALALAAGLSENEASDIVDAVQHLVHLKPTQRSAVMRLIRSLYEEADEQTS